MINEEIKQAFREYVDKENRMCMKLECSCKNCPVEHLCLSTYDLDGLLEQIDEVMNWQPKTDWSQVELDTPILVSGSNKLWYKGYFAGYDVGTGNVAIWKGGATSWSVVHEGLIPDRVWWKYAKLAERET